MGVLRQGRALPEEQQVPREEAREHADLDDRLASPKTRVEQDGQEVLEHLPDGRGALAAVGDAEGKGKRTRVELLLVVVDPQAQPFGPGHLGSEPDGGVDPFQDRLGHGVDQVLLVANVAVEGHRRDPELLREAPQADRLEAFGGADLEGPGHDGLTGQAGPSTRLHVLVWRSRPSSLDKYTPHT